MIDCKAARCFGVYVSAHFHERLLERHGYVLTPSERHELCRVAAQALEESPWIYGEESVELDCCVFGKRFVAIYVPKAKTIITCIHPRRGTGHRKFVKKVMPTMYTYIGETREEMAERHRHQRRANARRGNKPSGRPVARSQKLDALED